MLLRVLRLHKAAEQIYLSFSDANIVHDFLLADYRLRYAADFDACAHVRDFEFDVHRHFIAAMDFRQ